MRSPQPALRGAERLGLHLVLDRLADDLGLGAEQRALDRAVGEGAEQASI